MKKKTTPVIDHLSKGGEYTQFGEVVKLANKLSQKLNLSFIAENNTTCRVCFATSQELRSEFKTTFTAQDVVNYGYALINSKNYCNKNKSILKPDFNKIPCPKNADLFWKLVALGNNIRQIPPNEELLSALKRLKIEVDEIEFE